MNIGIDISQLAFPGSGVFTYTKELVTHLLKFQTKHRFTLFFSSFRQTLQVNFPDVKVVTLKLPPRFYELFWNNLHMFPVELFVGNVDVFHTSDWTEPPTRLARKVSTVHDLVVYKFPKTLHERILLNQKRKLDLLKKSDDMVIAVSHNTKYDLMELLGIEEKNIAVVYEGVSNIFTPKVVPPSHPYILCVGTREPRKNLLFAVSAFAQLLSLFPDIRLKIAGKIGWGDDVGNFIRQKNLGDKIELLGYVPDEELAVLYSGAQLFCYPSLYEGFGLPVLEAMACGCPVVTSNTSSLPEVAGDAALQVNPASIEEIAGAMEKVLNFSESDRKVYEEKGKKQASLFTWEKAAQETLHVYERMLER